MTHDPDPATIARHKLDRLKERIRRHGRMAVSLSGGVDSALLLQTAVDTLGPDQVLAVTIRAPNFPDREFHAAASLAGRLGVRHIALDWDPLTVPAFAQNAPDRCYHCKKELMLRIRDAAGLDGFVCVADGANADDRGDYRPGQKAARELGVVSPLDEADIGKADIRALARELGLDCWDKPALACLATRIPHGQPVTREAMDRIDRAEEYLRGLGFRQVRVRGHGDLARVEVDADKRGRFLEGGMMDAADAAIRGMGFAYVALDLRGYRTGSMNVGEG